jgi:hypothetical protein
MQARIVSSLGRRVAGVAPGSRGDLVNTVGYTISQTACSLQWKSRPYLYNTGKALRQAEVGPARRRLRDVYEAGLGVLQHDY